MGRNNSSLKDCAELEGEWFDRNLPGYQQQGKATGGQLIKKLVSMMCNYVEKTWVPSAEKQINEQVRRI